MVKKIKKTVIFTGYDCNNRCKFCMEANKRYLKSRSTNFIKKEITEAKQRGSDYLELIGGEVTIRNDFFDLIGFAKKLNFKTIMIATNGRMFSYQDIVYRALLAGLNSVAFSIHGHNKKIHDNLTQSKGSFDQLVRGVKNIIKISKKLGTNLNIGSNTCIVKQNYKYLPQIGKKIIELGIKNSEFIFVDSNEGGAFNDFYNFVPKISEAAPYIHQCLDIGKKENCSHWHIRYVPLCYFTDYLDQVSELNEVNFFDVEHISLEFKNFNVHEGRKKIGRIKTSECKKCRLNTKCEGLWKVYAEKYGTDELKLIK